MRPARARDRCQVVSIRAARVSGDPYKESAHLGMRSFNPRRSGERRFETDADEFV